MNEITTPEIKKEENLTQVDPNSIQKKPEISNESIKETQSSDETPQDRDWKKWKENRKKEREEAAKVTEAKIKAETEAAALRAALESLVNTNGPLPRHNTSLSNSEAMEDESEEKRIERRVNEALSKREQELERQRHQKDLQEYPNKLRNTYPDFNQICTQENLDYLEFHHPELSKSLSKTADGFDKWADIYNAVKRYIPNPKSSSDSKRADRNLQKPQSFQNSGLTPPEGQSSARLEEKRRAENWERMQRTLKGLN